MLDFAENRAYNRGMELLYDKEKLIEILTEFNNVTGIRISFLEDYNVPVIGIPGDNCALCSFKQRDKAFYNKCKECDKTSFLKAKEQGELYIYECHYHLTEAVQPIKFNGETLGYFLLGQILTDKKRFLEENKPTSYEKTLLSQFTETPINVVSSYAKILSWVVQYTILNNDIRINHRSSFKTIVAYIKKNYAEQLSVDLLCKEFHYSRSSLFTLFKNESGLSVMEFVNETRLNKAKELLSTHSVSKVAEMVGISDNNYFSRIFKKRYGITPSQFKSHATPKTEE